MDKLIISKETTKSRVFDLIEERVIIPNKKHALLEFDVTMNVSECTNIVSYVKENFDIFIVLVTELPDKNVQIEKYFSYGIHAIYFYSLSEKYLKNQLEILEFISGIFPEGAVFIQSPGDKEIIELILGKKIIPIIPRCENEESELIDFIRNHHKFTGISLNYLKYIPIFGDNHMHYSLLDKIKIKMVLETGNLRQKLMVKNIDDSFNSSGL